MPTERPSAGSRLRRRPAPGAGTSGAAERGQHDDANRPVLAGQFGRKLEAGHPRHLDVGQHDCPARSRACDSAWRPSAAGHDLDVRLGPTATARTSPGVAEGAGAELQAAPRGRPRQHQVRLHVAVAVVPPLAAQPMVVMPGFERMIVGQYLHHRDQAAIEERPMPAPRLTPVIALELARGGRRRAALERRHGGTGRGEGIHLAPADVRSTCRPLRRPGPRSG